MQDLEEKSIKNIIRNIILERADEFQWSSIAPSSYIDCDYENDNETVDNEPTIPQSPTLTTLTNIRNICDSIQSNIVNSNTLDENFLSMELINIENKLRELNDTLNTLQNFTNNQAKLLTGDIILS